MTTFYDPAKIRELAASGDAFWKGAAWVLDQQAAARVPRRPNWDDDWTPIAPPDTRSTGE